MSSGSPVQHVSIFDTPLGWIGVKVTPKGVRQIVPPRSSRRQVERELRVNDRSGALYPIAIGRMIENHLMQARAQLLAYCEGRRRVFTLPLDLEQGTAFQRRVWQRTLQIPYGKVSSYRKIATALGRASLARAVGSALGANPLPLVVPCHRVLSSDGSLGGYSGGVQIKQDLLRLEGIEVPAVFRPHRRGG